jgi:hypothetical protein
MSHDLLEAAAALAETLAEENQALRAMDLQRAVAMLARKHRATDAFAAAQAGAQLPVAARAQAEKLAQHLRTQTDENKRLLEQAIAVQSRVIGLLTRNVPKALDRSPRYTSGGALAQARTPAIALSARA